jgi:hypothetical protein
MKLLVVEDDTKTVQSLQKGLKVARCPQELGNLDPDLSSSISNAAL